jgi:Domain of unknown function (DUF5071)
MKIFWEQNSMVLPNELHELLPKDKHDLEQATALVSIGYPTVAPILPDLLEWLQDGNWPVSHVIGPFLASIGKPLTEEVRRILQAQDHLWKYWILLRVVAHSPELATALHSELVKIAEGDTVDEDEKEVKEVAKEILSGS